MYFLFVTFLMMSCSVSKYIPDEKFLLDKVEIKCLDKNFDAGSLRPYIHQKGNSKWFSIFKVPLGAYALSGTDTTKFINRTLRNLGEKPVIYDTLQSRLTCDDLRNAMRNMGYMNAQVDVDTQVRGRKIKAVYTLYPGEPYYINKVYYDVPDDSIAAILDVGNKEKWGIRKGMKFTVNGLDAERKRITRFLTDRGYYKFNKDYIRYTVDTLRGSRYVDVTLHLMLYRAHGSSEYTTHPRYSINSVVYHKGDDGKTHLRKNVLQENTWIKENGLYSASDLQKTYNSFGRLSAVRYTNIKFSEFPDTTMLDCNIQINTVKPNSISFQPEGTNTAGDLGAAATLTYENRNIFRGSEMLTVQLRGAFEAITGLEGYQNQNYEEYSLETKLTFPRMITPFLSRRFRRNSQATSELSIGYNMQNRPEFHRRILSTAWRYRWSNRNRRTAFRIDLVDLNYVYMPWISSTFKEDYLDNAGNRNAILRYNYEDLFIMRTGGSMSYNDGTNAFKGNFEVAGNVLDAACSLSGSEKNGDGQYTLFNIAFAQYVKLDLDYTRQVIFDEHNSLAMHVGIGIAYPYGNSTVLPFEKRYFSGGANSVRGWNVRELGPGRFKGNDGRIDFINQTGDMKLDLNVEYRTFLFWKIYGAAFVDAGNIWTLRQYAEQPGGQFRLDSFYEQIAVGYGLGIRLNMNYFLLRFDVGMKAVNPAYDTQKEHYAVFHPDFSRDFSFHFAVGLPF